MLVIPDSEVLQKHIDHYWILNDLSPLQHQTQGLFAYPGVTPDLILVLDGFFSMSQNQRIIRTAESWLFGFLPERVQLDLSGLRRCILIKFKSHGLSSLLPFLSVDAQTFMKNPVVPAEAVFGDAFRKLLEKLKQAPSETYAEILDQWFSEHHHREKEGFMVALAAEVSSHFQLPEIMTQTGYSYSTLERYFKKDTGLTPKRFQTLQRFKKAIRELYSTENTEWMHYVDTYGYYDQSHFIKECKRFTGSTPSELLALNSFIGVRPDYL